METGGQIGIELRLLMDKLKGDIAAAAKTIKRDLSGTALAPATEKTADGMEKTAASVDKTTNSIKRATSAWKEMKEAAKAAWREQEAKRVPKVTFAGSTSKGMSGQIKYAVSAEEAMTTGPVETGAPKIEALKGIGLSPAAIAAWQGRLATKGNIGGSDAPSQRMPMHMAPEWMLARGAQRAMGMGPLFGMTRFQELQGIGKAIALNAAAFTAALASLRVAVGLVKYAFSGLLQPLSMLQRSMEEARSRYATSLTSGGLPLGFTSRRSVLASVIGVGEGEVLKYAGAVKQLNEMVAISSKVHAETAQSLAMGAWKVRAFKEDWKAMLENVTYLYTPARNRITTWLDEILKTFIARQNAARKAADEAWAKEKAVLQERQKALQEQIKAGAFGSVRFGQERHDKIARMKAEGELKQITDKLKAHEIANAPEASAHRLRSSPWEQMGMVIGWGAAENPMKQTAKNTAKSAEYLGQMAAAFGLNRGVARTGSMSLYPINLP